MDHTPPRKLPSRPPSLLITPYKSLPDPGKAALPPKPPPVTPASMGPVQYLSPMVPLATPPQTPQTPQKNSNGRVRKYSRANDGLRIPAQQISPTKVKKSTKANQTTLDGWKKNNVVVKQGQVAAVPAKFQTSGVNTHYSNINYSNNNNKNNNKYHYHYHNSNIINYNHTDNRRSSGYKSNNMNSDNKNKPHPSFSHASEKEDPISGLQRIHNQLLRGATTLTKAEQDLVTAQMTVDYAYLSPLMMRLVVDRVANKTHQLSYAIAHWAHRRGDLWLVEDALADRLFRFDVGAAFDERLMSVDEVAALMDCQMVLHHVRMERSEQKAKMKKETEVAGRGANANTNASTYEDDSDSDSVDMDLSAD